MFTKKTDFQFYPNCCTLVWIEPEERYFRANMVPHLALALVCSDLVVLQD